METAATIAMKAAPCVAAAVAASDKAARGSAPETIPWPVAKPGPVAISGPIAEAPAVVAESGAAIKAASEVAAIPGARADKHAAYEVVRPVIAIRRASVRIVVVVTIGADRGWSIAPVCGTYSNAERHLRLRVSCGKKQSPQQCSVL
jgi:hypothetical protein